MKNNLLALALAVLLLGVAYTAKLAHRISSHTAFLEQPKHPHMEPATATWISGGIEITVTTVQDTTSTPPESVDEWAKRHRARVNAMLVEFPRDS